MELERFNKSTLPMRVATGKPTIRITFNGAIAFNKMCAEKLGLNDKARVEIVRNKNAPNEWFLLVSDDEKAFPLRATKNATTMIFQNAPLAQAMIKAVAAPELALKNMTMRVGISPVENEIGMLYPILTNSYKEFLKN
jgi:hypothetical protein